MENGNSSDHDGNILPPPPPKLIVESLEEEDDAPPAKPKLIIFDLDYTLWPFCVDRKINIEPPFSKTPAGKVFDACSREVKPFPDVDTILRRLSYQGYRLGVVSEALKKEPLKSLINCFEWEKYFDHCEIYPGSKIQHFLKIKKDSGVDFNDMMFFDDERDHLSEVAHTCIGLTCIWANRGVSEEILEEGMTAFAKNHKLNAPLLNASNVSINSNDSDESQSETTVIYVHKRRGSRASITYDIPPVIDRAIRLRGRRMSAPAISIPNPAEILAASAKHLASPPIIEN
ncbi:hypothetical protein KUTeg_019296 [Tegillarca granosa]|uniref:Magnesium-dependent phosphatase 1 n=1 Tax=Tegillarca granosa TaxID=220873 RepID=A0ABQ9ECK4_TEGGR|nr:hypothetical protein KUTeg_019296 [Tegillarca granosa]